MTNRWTVGLAFVLVVQLASVGIAQPPEGDRPEPPVRRPVPADGTRSRDAILEGFQEARERTEAWRAQAEATRRQTEASRGQPEVARGQRGQIGTRPQQDLGLLPAEIGQTFFVTITEFRLSEAIDSRLSPDEIVALFDSAKSEGKAELIESVGLSTIESLETSVRFSKRIAVTVGAMMSPAAGRIRNVQDREVGTLVRLVAESRGEQVAVRLAYEASRMVGEGADDAPPDTHSIQLSSTLLLEPGVPKLVGRTTGDGTSFLIVEVTE